MNFYFLCATQSSNVGDLLINKMLIDELCRYGYVYVDCYNISAEFKKYILDNNKAIDVYGTNGFSIKKGNIIQFCFFLRKANIGCFTQSPGPLGKLTKSYAIYFKLISYILKFLKIKYYLIGNCCSKSRLLNENISINNADGYYLRSKSSLAYLKKCGINNVHYIPDLAFLYRRNALITDEAKTAVLCFRETKLDYNKFIEWLKCIISLLHINGYRVEFIYQVYKDKEFTYKLQEDLSKMFKDLIFNVNILWYNNINYYSGKTVVISNRLHSLLLAAVHNAIPLAFSDNTTEFVKINDVYNSIFRNNASDLFLSIDSFSKIQNVLNNIDVIKANIVSIVDYNLSLCEDTIKEICNKL